MTRNNAEMQLGANSSDYQMKYSGIVKGDRYTPQLHQVEAIHIPTGRQAGFLHWAHSDEGKSSPIYQVTTHADHQRKGVATAMYQFASQLGNEGTTNPIRYSNNMTPSGAKWRRFMQTGQRGYKPGQSPKELEEKSSQDRMHTFMEDYWSKQEQVK